MKLLIDIPDKDYEIVKDAEGCRWTPAIIRGVVNGTPIPDNATNGDVIRALYPKAYIQKEIERYSVEIEYDGGDSSFMVSYPDDWWNAPYKADKE